MQLGVLLLPALRRDVPLDLDFTPVETDGADVAPVRPELAAPEVFFHSRHSAEHLASGEALDHPHDLGGALQGNRMHQEVHVVPVCADHEKRDLVARRDLQEDVPEHLVHVRRDHRAAVLPRADKVLEQDGDIAAAMDVFTHAPRLPQPDAASRGVWTDDEWNPKVESLGPARRQHGRWQTDQSLRSLRQGGRNSTVTRACQATGAAHLAPPRNRRRKVRLIARARGKWAGDEKVPDGSGLTKWPGLCFSVNSGTIRSR